MIQANLYEGYQMWHVLEIVGCEINVTSRLDSRQSFVDL